MFAPALSFARTTPVTESPTFNGFNFSLHTAPSSICSGVNKLKTLSDIVNFFTCFILKSIVPLLFAVALAIFVYGVITYFMHANDSTKREEGSKFMLWGIIALAVMFSVWGLVKILTNTFGIDFGIPLLKQ